MNMIPATGPVTIDAGLSCEFCDRRLVRVTVRWLAAATLSDYCAKSPAMFHSPAGSGDVARDPDDITCGETDEEIERDEALAIARACLGTSSESGG